MRVSGSSFLLLTLTWSAATLQACQSSDRPVEPTQPEPEPAANVAAPAEAAPEPAVVPPDKRPAQELMKGHFARAADAREDLIKGDIEAARASMKWLAEHKHAGDLDAELQPLLTAMQTSAAEFAKATTLREAGVSLALTLNRCGDCHLKAEAGPEIAIPPLPDGETAKAHMRRHLWAAQRMWEGLVTRNAETFSSGTEVLAESPLHPEALVPGDQKETVAKLVTHLHELGEKAKAAKQPAEQAEVYGNFLATCAACHRLLGRGPGAAAEAPGDTAPTE